MKSYPGVIYQCEYCGKKSAWKHVITNHEKICKKKPVNMHKCFQYCAHLEKEQGGLEKEHYSDVFEDFDYEEAAQFKFKCAITNKYMYSYKLERNQIANKERIKGLQRMPVKCEHYECNGGNSGDYEPPTS